jgi:hypothetical protein
MPAGDPNVSGCSPALVALFEQVHPELRAAIEALGEDGINCVPCSGANSPATIVVHLLGSEAEALKVVAGVPAMRDRDAEFVATHRTVKDGLALIDQADELLAELGPPITDEQLQQARSLPTLDSRELRRGARWLAGNLGHAREHMGHLGLTAQLCRLKHN